MDKSRVNIAIIEPSDIVFEGLSNLMFRSDSNLFLFRASDLDDLGNLLVSEKIRVVILSPAIIQNREDAFYKLKNRHSSIVWIALIYAFISAETLNKFDEYFSITDPQDIIINKVSRTADNMNLPVETLEELSERETDVLILLVNGLSNKEIADKLNLSIHTVNSHRKNIIDKTGIKSLSGLTIYAITRKLIPLKIS